MAKKDSGTPWQLWMSKEMIATVPGMPARVYLALLWHRNVATGLCSPSLRRLADFADSTEQHISRAIDSLVKQKLVSRAPFKGGESRLQYTFNSPEVMNPNSSQPVISKGVEFTTNGAGYSPDVVAPIRNVTNESKLNDDDVKDCKENEDTKRAKLFLESNGATPAQLGRFLEADVIGLVLAWESVWPNFKRDYPGTKSDRVSVQPARRWHRSQSLFRGSTQAVLA